MNGPLALFALLAFVIGGYGLGIAYGRYCGGTSEYRKRAAKLRAQAYLALSRETAKKLYDEADMYARLANGSAHNARAEQVTRTEPA